MNISILVVKRKTVDNSAYSTSKSGVTNLIQNLNKELAPKGIKVNAVYPVLIETPGLVTTLDAKYSPLDKSISSFSENFKQNQAALGRIITASKIVWCCLFLVFQKARGITGQSKKTDCGVLPN